MERFQNRFCRSSAGVVDIGYYIKGRFRGPSPGTPQTARCNGDHLGGVIARVIDRALVTLLRYGDERRAPARLRSDESVVPTGIAAPFVLALAPLRCAPLRLSAMTYGGTLR